MLTKKRDPVTHVRFVDEIMESNEHPVGQAFWERLCDTLGREFARVAHGGRWFFVSFGVN